MHLQYDDDFIREVLTEAKTIAIVGASPKPERASHYVMAYLKARGYRTIPVNPLIAGQELLGEHVYASLRDIPVQVDMVDVFRRSEEAPALCDDAIKIGAKSVWMQLGVIHGDAARHASDAGLKVIMDRCPKIEMPRLGLD